MFLNYNNCCCWILIGLYFMIFLIGIDSTEAITNTNTNNNNNKNNQISNNLNNNKINNNKNTNNEKLQDWRINEKIRRKFFTVQSTLDCHERTFTFKAIQTDPITGLQCSDYIKLLSCWGRCNSGEISDYRFPYKRSFHNVCIHDVLEKRLFELTNCDPGAPDHLRWYQTVVAKSCVCRQCQTSMVNCESASIDLDYN